jgi:hypothetical protein
MQCATGDLEAPQHKRSINLKNKLLKPKNLYLTSCNIQLMQQQPRAKKKNDL